MNAVAKELARQAKKAGICEEWHGQLKLLTDKDAMIDMYIKGIDFCLSNDYPSNDYIREHFKGAMEQKGVFLDDAITLEVDAFDDSSLHVIASDDAKVHINRYGGEIEVEKKGNGIVKVDQKDKKTY